MERNPRTVPIVCFLSALAIGILTAAPLAQSQSSSNAPPQSIEDALHQMSDQAGIVFVGEVTAIRHIEGANGASGVVEVEFRIDQAVRGCTTGSTYILREWAGLWTGGGDRYRPGQRLLMLLHTPGANGITSPVGGMAGAIPVHGGDTAPRATDTSTTHQPTIADLRWVATKIQRTAAYSNTAAVQTTTITAANVSDASVPTQQATVDVVVNLLATSQKVAHDIP